MAGDRLVVLTGVEVDPVAAAVELHEHVPQEGAVFLLDSDPHAALRDRDLHRQNRESRIVRLPVRALVVLQAYVQDDIMGALLDPLDAERRELPGGCAQLLLPRPLRDGATLRYPGVLAPGGIPRSRSRIRMCLHSSLSSSIG